jgi:hypothetical protein
MKKIEKAIEMELKNYFAQGIPSSIDALAL